MWSAIRHGDRRVPAFALTFDDGPGAVTAPILDVLRLHGARATFDVLGERIAGREELLRRAVADGHEIGVHGWSHGDHRRRRIAAARGAGRTAALVAAVCGVRPRLYRPPFGLTDRRLQLAMRAHGLRTVLWDVDPRDFEEPGAPVIYERAATALRPGSIVLLHDDRPALAPTAEAVDLLLQHERRPAVTVSELLACAGRSSCFSPWASPPAAAAGSTTSAALGPGCPRPRSRGRSTATPTPSRAATSSGSRRARRRSGS